MKLSSPQPVRKLLVANRGEIAVRILNAARELDIETYAVYTDHDTSHTYNAVHSIKLVSPDIYTDISQLIQIVRQYNIDAVHPGYGFLSESVELAARIANETSAIVIGPGVNILSQTGNKLHARKLAETCHVPVLPALLTPTADVETVRDFAVKVGYPIMIKAVDGGGGRGIRMVTRETDLSSLMARAVEESLSRQVFVEKAAANGFRHIEVQVIGDLHGNITNLWERECSIQRRYQKVVEIAPSSVTDRKLISNIIDSALRMAKQINYVSLGTFEFLANPQNEDFFFLEINPRLQVEHTVTESIALTDLVRLQLRIAEGATLVEAGLGDRISATMTPRLHSLQLRITAEDVANNWSLSVGKIQSFHFPSGQGVRVDTYLVHGIPAIVSADFDSLLAKIIVTAPTWQEVLCKAERALTDTRIIGIETNLKMLQAIVSHEDFVAGRCDTSWLENNHESLLATSKRLPRKLVSSPDLFVSNQISSPSASPSSSLFRKGDAWTLSLQSKASSTPPLQRSHLEITKVLRNDFPTTFSADVAFTPQDAQNQSYTLHLESTTASASALSTKHRRGSPKDPGHIIIPFSGKLVEVLVDVGDMVKRGDVVCVVKQMKMELEVRAPSSGTITWVTEAEDDDDVAEGMLAATVEAGGKVEAKL